MGFSSILRNFHHDRTKPDIETEIALAQIALPPPTRLSCLQKNYLYLQAILNFEVRVYIIRIIQVHRSTRRSRVMVEFTATDCKL